MAAYVSSSSITSTNFYNSNDFPLTSPKVKFKNSSINRTIYKTWNGRALMNSPVPTDVDVSLGKRMGLRRPRRGRPVKGAIRADGTEWIGAVEAIQKYPTSHFADLAASTTNIISKARYTALQRLNEGAPLTVVAAEYSVSTQTVSSWAGRFRDGGSTLLEAMQGSISIVKQQGDAVALRKMAEVTEDLTRRTALVALAEVVEGKSVKETSSDHRFVHTQFAGWVEKFNALGMEAISDQALLPAFRLPLIVMRSDHDRDAIAAVLATSDEPELRTRLDLIVRLYEGRELGEIAAETNISTTTIRKWAERFNRDGISGLRPSVPGEELRDDFDAVQIDAIGARSDDIDVQRRCRAIANIYRGCRKLQVAQEAGITRAALYIWCKRFNERGEKWLIGEAVKPWSYRKAISGSNLKVPPPVSMKTEISAPDMARLSDCLARCLRHPEPLAPGMVKAWIRMELDILIDNAGVEAALVRSGYGILRGRVVEKAVLDLYAKRKAIRELKAKPFS
jgi:transposase